MARNLILVACLLMFGGIQQAQAGGCLNYNGGYFYTATALGQNCSTVCSNYGGFDILATRHTGNAVGQHFYPNKSNGYNWMTIECSSVDSNTNWGATGDVPDITWTHDQCYVHCACNVLPPNGDSCDMDLCYGVAEGGDCRGGNGTSCGSYKCLQGVCTLDTSTNVTRCGTDTQCRVFSCARGECLSADVNNDQPCTPPDSSSSSECQAFVCNQGECVAKAISEGNACTYNGCATGFCSDGTCVVDTALPDGIPCTDNNACTTNDVCISGECYGNTTVDCGQCSTCNPLLGCMANKNITCDDGDDTTCNDTCRFDFFTPQGVCVGTKCSTPGATTNPSSFPSSTTTPSSTTPSSPVVSRASLVMAVPYLILALGALM